MGNTIEEIAQKIYRRHRRKLAPQEALQAVAGEFRHQADMARNSRQIYSESLARDLAKVALRADELAKAINDRRGWDTPHQRFWQTGKRDHQRGWIVMAERNDGWIFFRVECDNAGCAAKHGLHVLTQPEMVAFYLYRPGFKLAGCYARYSTIEHLSNLLGEGE